MVSQPPGLSSTKPVTTQSRRACSSDSSCLASVHALVTEGEVVVKAVTVNNDNKMTVNADLGRASTHLRWKEYPRPKENIKYHIHRNKQTNRQTETLL